MWPLDRGRGRLVRLLLSGFEHWPERATFRFRYGCFVNAPVGVWPKGYRELFINGVMEPGEVAMWRRALRPGDKVVDGGANWGYWSLVGARMVGKTGTVYAFEPVPASCAALRRNVQASRVHNVVIHPVALSDHRGVGQMTLVEDDPFLGGATLGPRQDVLKGKTVVECQMSVLDEVLSHERIRLVKLDVEGGEYAALRGAAQMLRRDDKPIITFEWNRAMAAGLGYEPEAIRELLSSNDYALHLVSGRSLVPFEERKDIKAWIPMVWALTKAQRLELGM